MFSSFFSGAVPKFGFGKTVTSGRIDIPAAKTYNIEVSQEKRDRRLKHLLKLNHANFAILYHNLQFHNHTPHILGSAYALGANSERLTEIYEHAAREGHEPWTDAPGEIALHDYRDFLGKRDYQRAWVDFFEDQLVDNGYSWQNVTAKFLLDRGSKSGPNPYAMISCLTAGLGHPLIHLGYAYELSSREVAMEALGLVAACYDPKLAALLENNSAIASRNQTANPLTYSTSNPFEVLARVHGDKRLDEAFNKVGDNNLSRLLGEASLTAILIEHFNAWKITDPKEQFSQTQRLAASLLMSTAPTKPTLGHGYDFFLLHVLTTSQAVRIVIPHLPAEYHISLLREWFLITLALYIAQLRPIVATYPQAIKDFDLDGQGWDDTVKLALEGEHRFDEHYVKGIRAMKEAAELWGDGDEFYIKCAVKFATEFEQWGGFEEETTSEEASETAKRPKRRGSFY